MTHYRQMDDDGYATAHMAVPNPKIIYTDLPSRSSPSSRLRLMEKLPMDRVHDFYSLT